MSAEARPERSLERAVAVLDTVIESLVEMRPAGLRRAPAKLSDAVAAVNAVLQRSIAASEKAAIESTAKVLRARVAAAIALLAGAQRLCSGPSEDFNGYTAEGETERFHTPGSLLFEL